MKVKLKIWYYEALAWLLVKVFQVKKEYLTPLSWKVVDDYDMLRLVTKSPNVLCLKSSVNFDIRGSFVADIQRFDQTYGKNEIIFLFDQKISQTTNNNLKLDDNGLGYGINYEFKFALKTLHGKFITKLIKKIIRFNTDKLLAVAKEYNDANPDQRQKEEVFNFSAKLTSVNYDPENIFNSQGFKDAIEEEKILKAAAVKELNEDYAKSLDDDDTSIESQIEQHQQLEKEWKSENEIRKEFEARNFKN
jgi:hypothetical protein